MLLLGLLALVHADDAACVACCRAGGLAGCSADIQVFGEGAQVTREARGWRVVGLWAVGCDGNARLDEGATALLDHEPRLGELVAVPPNPLQAHCFRQACALPEDLCLQSDAYGRFDLLGCDSGLPPSARELSRPPVAEAPTTSTVVVVEGRPLVVTPVAATVPPILVRPDPGFSGPPPGVPAQPAVPVPGTVPSVRVGGASAPSSTEALVALDLPADPPDACRAPPEAVRGEARRRVEMGDERRIARDTAGALREYRAALTMDACNGYAWLGIGEVAGGLARPDVASRALRNATALMPAHYGAWTSLGKAYEGLGQATLAADAYGKALAARPGLPEALEGWRRTASPGTAAAP